MYKIISLSLFTILLCFSSYSQNAMVNAKTSSVHWLGKKITGQHEGFIKIKSGMIESKDNKIISGNIQMDMNSMSCTDIEPGSSNDRLIKHLKSDDFFGVKSFPIAELKVTESTEFVNNKASLTADLTIKGKTEVITFQVIKIENGYSAIMNVDRSKYDVRYGSTSFFDSLGNKAIDDVFTLTIELAIK